MHILVVGAGVIGTVYGAHLGAANHRISVLATVNARRRSPCAVSMPGTSRPASRRKHRLRSVTSAAELDVDVVLVALRRDHLHGAAAALAGVTSDALVLFMGNNPAGRSEPAQRSRRTSRARFPGVGARCATTSSAIHDRAAANGDRSERQSASRRRGRRPDPRGLPVQRVSEMDGWLAYHAVFVAAISAGLYRCGTDPTRLADDRATLKLTCAAITEGFRALHADRVQGCPRNLAVLHNRWLTPIAIRYWAGHAIAHGGIAFAAHARHAEPEMRRLAQDVIARLPRTDSDDAIHTLLGSRS